MAETNGRCQVFRMEARPGAVDAGALGAHILGRVRPVNALAREGYDPVVVLHDDLEGAAAVWQAEIAKPRRGPKPAGAIDILIGGPPPMDGPDRWDDETVARWARDSLDWIRRACPDAPIAAAALHLDERSPHVHALLVPMSRDRKTGRMRLGNKGVRGSMAATAPPLPKGAKRRKGQHRNEMARVQDAYHHHVAARYGLGRGTVGSTARHVDVDPLRGAQDRLSDAAATVRAAEDEAAAKLRSAERDAGATRKAAEGFVAGVRGRREAKAKAKVGLGEAQERVEKLEADLESTRGSLAGANKLASDEHARFEKAEAARKEEAKARKKAEADLKAEQAAREKAERERDSARAAKEGAEAMGIKIGVARMAQLLASTLEAAGGMGRIVLKWPCIKAFFRAGDDGDLDRKWVNGPGGPVAIAKRDAERTEADRQARARQSATALGAGGREV